MESKDKPRDTPVGKESGKSVVKTKAKTQTPDVPTTKPTVESGGEITAVKPKRKRNRPDMENFGHEYVEPGDNTRYLRNALAIWDLPPIDISDQKQVEDRIKWYFQKCMEDDVKPGVVGLSNALGVTRDTLWDWKSGNTRAGTHSDVVKKAYGILEQMWEDYMQNGKINPVSGIFLGKNHFGYKDQTELKVATNGDEATIPQEQLEEKYRDLLTDGTIEGEGKIKE